MWGRFYWGRKEEGGKKAEGIVVLFSWLSSHEKHLMPYVDLYWSHGWGCLVCHVDFLTLNGNMTNSSPEMDMLTIGNLPPPMCSNSFYPCDEIESILQLDCSNAEPEIRIHDLVNCKFPSRLCSSPRFAPKLEIFSINTALLSWVINV